MIKIDKNVPMVLRNGGHGTVKYPWREMEIGDSFFVSGRSVATMRGQAWAVAKGTGRRFSCATVEGGVRVWRVS